MKIMYLLNQHVDLRVLPLELLPDLLVAPAAAPAARVELRKVMKLVKEDLLLLLPYRCDLS